jgi:hypothetical protein
MFACVNRNAGLGGIVVTVLVCTHLTHRPAAVNPVVLDVALCSGLDVPAVSSLLAPSHLLASGASVAPVT